MSTATVRPAITRPAAVPADDPGFERVLTTRAFEAVSAQIRSRVIDGRLRAGDRLPAERELAQTLGVGRNTVREALRGLEMAGVVRLAKGPLGGAFVVAPDGRTVSAGLQDMFRLGSVTADQLTEARLLITESVVRVACARMAAAEVDALEHNVEASQRAARDGDAALRSRINLEFHLILARATGNPILVAVMTGLIGVMQHFVDTLGPPSVENVYASRRRFIRHLRARDADAAIAEMARFLRGVHRQYLSRLDGGVPR